MMTTSHQPFEVIDGLEHLELADGALMACLEQLRDPVPWLTKRNALGGHCFIECGCVKIVLSYSF